MDQDDQKHSLPWYAEIVQEDGQTPLTVAPTWVTTFGTEGAVRHAGTGSIVEPQTFPTVITMQDPDLTHPDPFQPGVVPPVSNYDLSTKGGRIPMSTANCYIVVAPGTYKLPLVYGNAIKDGQPNEGSYISEVQSTYNNPVLETFINNLNNPITDPYIYNNEGCTPSGATLVWQDSPGLIENVALDATGQYLTFEVVDAYFKQANAIVSVLGPNEEIMWSWHIWTTIYSPAMDKVVVNQDNERYTFMSANLGWCGYGDIQAFYPDRSFKVRFTQIGTGLTQLVTVRQESYADLGKSGNELYYQYGRPSPLPAVLEEVKSQRFVEKPLYYTDPKYTVTFLGKVNGRSVRLYEALQTPYNFYNFNGTFWSEDGFLNFWDINCATRATFTAQTTKSVYDPCPLGYKVPPIKAFLGFTIDQRNYGAGVGGIPYSYGTSYVAGNYKNVNTPYSSLKEVQDDNGYTFYCYPMNPTTRECDPSGGTIFFPITKFRQGSGGYVPDNVDNKIFGAYWSSTQHTKNEAYSLLISKGTGTATSATISGGGVFPQNRYKIGSAYGYPIRPIRDE